MLPDWYISNTEERLLLYQKIAEIDNEKDLQKFEEELIDRFGSLPKKL
jgi:transcription-repair coupling factor (superfamily II helicase)